MDSFEARLTAAIRSNDSVLARFADLEWRIYGLIADTQHVMVRLNRGRW